jgi:uncharacterized protein (TIRG00374 family)
MEAPSGRQGPPEDLEEDENEVRRVPPGKRRLSGGGFLLSVLIAVGVVFLLFRLTDVSPSLVLETLRGVSPGALALGLALHVGTYLLRCIRLRLVLHSARPPFGSLFDIVAVHNLMNHVLPFRTGELSYVYLIRSMHGVPVAEGLGTLAICRIMDLMAFALYYPLAITLLWLQGFRFPSYVWPVLWSVAPLFFLLAALLAVLSLRGRALVGLLRRVCGRGRLAGGRWQHRILEKLEEAALSFEHLGARKVYLGAFAVSLAILGLIYFNSYILLAGMGYPMGILLVVFCSTLASLGLLLPLYSFGGFGTLEAGWTVGCLMAGFSKEMGMASGLTFHLIALGYVTLMGLYGLARLGRAGWAGSLSLTRRAGKEGAG